eukprot:4891608-Pyramimonas_sp.AAC.1
MHSLHDWAKLAARRWQAGTALLTLRVESSAMSAPDGTLARRGKVALLAEATTIDTAQSKRDTLWSWAA